MKKIEAIIRSEKFNIVKDALLKLGYAGMIVTLVSEVWRGRSFQIVLLSKVKIEITVKDVDMEKIVDTIINRSQTGSIGDGKIFISHIENVYRIQTKESGETAIY